MNIPKDLLHEAEVAGVAEYLPDALMELRKKKELKELQLQLFNKASIRRFLHAMLAQP
jgi:hypothetical protein